MVQRNLRRLSCLLLFAALSFGCSSYQPTKNVWKGTKNLWYTYVSPPASVDYDDKGTLSPRALALTNSMMGIDVELGKLERVMLNADKPPTREWMTSFFSSFPWMSGFAGVKYDGTILGREPASSMKELDFIPLLYEDSKQNSRALRGDVQSTPLGPEVLLATPLYDGVDFLGIVVAHFDFRALLQYSQSPQNIVVLSPYALLWPGDYDFASTPLAGINWSEAVTKSSSGTCSNANGSFFYMVRYLGNLPLVFAVAENDNFPKGDGSLEQGLAFFPGERENLPPPPMPERKDSKTVQNMPSFEAQQSAEQLQQNAAPARHDAATDIQPGNQGSVLMQQKRPTRKSNVQERQLDGENIEVERVQPVRKRKVVNKSDTKPSAGESRSNNSDSVLPAERPSPFGPRENVAPPSIKMPSPFGPADSREKSAERPSSPDASKAEPSSGGQEVERTKEGSQVTPPATLPGGRPSPFGPK